MFGGPSDVSKVTVGSFLYSDPVCVYHISHCPVSESSGWLSLIICEAPWFILHTRFVLESCSLGTLGASSLRVAFGIGQGL